MRWPGFLRARASPQSAAPAVGATPLPRSEERLDARGDRVDREAGERADHRAVDADELQIASDLQLELLGGLTRVPALDGLGDDPGDLAAVVAHDVGRGIRHPLVDLPGEFGVGREPDA